MLDIPVMKFTEHLKLWPIADITLFSTACGRQIARNDERQPPPAPISIGIPPPSNHFFTPPPASSLPVYNQENSLDASGGVSTIKWGVGRFHQAVRVTDSEKEEFTLIDLRNPAKEAAKIFISEEGTSITIQDGVSLFIFQGYPNNIARIVTDEGFSDIQIRGAIFVDSRGKLSQAHVVLDDQSPNLITLTTLGLNSFLTSGAQVDISEYPGETTITTLNAFITVFGNTYVFDGRNINTTPTNFALSP